MPVDEVKTVDLAYLKFAQGEKELLLTMMSAELLAEISYVAVRRKDQEEGAVQRPLTEKRISSICDFAIAGGDFPVCIVLNWVESARLQVTKEHLKITIAKRSAQIIDGQHRVAGLNMALSRSESFRKMMLPVVIYRGLGTQDCADIFLSINTEQKPVPKSLAYDLFGLASSRVVDTAALRAADIANLLNENEESPYYGMIRYSGEKRTKGPKGILGIALSTVVAALKPLVAEKGVLDSINISELVTQTKVLTTYFAVLKEWCGDKWEERDNAFMHASGFTGAVEFLKLHLIPYCNTTKSFTAASIRGAMGLPPETTISRLETARLQGRASARVVTELLYGWFKPATESKVQDFEF